MSRSSRAVGRLPLPGRRTRGELAHLREVTAHLQHVVESMNHTVVQLAATVERLDHDLRSDMDEALPLSLGISERLRIDADTSIGAAQVIARDVAGLQASIAALHEHLDRFDARA